jgi:hypothetical protein
MAISVTQPLGSAMNRAIAMTFKPFDLGRWFVLGFIAWLAELGENVSGSGGGGGRGGVRLPAPGPGPGPATTTTQPAPTSLPAPFDQIWNWITLHLVLVVVALAVALAIIVAIWLLIMWINSRGKFMLLHAIATNTAKVVEPWKQFRELGNSFFGFKVVMAVLGVVVLLVVTALPLLVAWPDISNRAISGHTVVAVLLFIVLWLPAALFLGLTVWAGNHFVTTIMYARRCRVGPAWREFAENVMTGHVGTLILFLLMEILLGVAAAFVQVTVGCMTCCIGFLPYISTVVLLPIALFLRCYSIYFLQQFGAPYVIIHELPPPPPPGAFPVVTPANPVR